MIITPKNWHSFQHYKDREPLWIKLHKNLLVNYEYTCLPVASKALAPMLWLLASEYKDGIIDASLDKIAFRLHMTRGDLADALSPLIESGFFDASEPLADGYQPACLEREDIEKKEEIEEEIEQCRVSRKNPTMEKYSEDFEANFWKPFPRTAIMSKKEAWREWGRLDPEQRLTACRAIDPYKLHLKQNPTLNAVHACRFLSQNRAEGILELAAEKPAFDVRKHMI
jgi:hypothetical protein